MNTKIVFVIYFVGVTQGVLIDSSKHRNMNINDDHHSWQMTTVYHPPHSKVYSYKYEPYAYPKYEFEYSVSDKKTGDHKHHQESRDGDRVRGEYSLVEADGSLRKVQYHADDHNGFNAVVSKTVNKHGDHAISITDHTRFFYPVGRGIKINHYFPGNNYHVQNPGKPSTENDSKPVHEEKELSNTKDKDESNNPDSESKVMLMEPLKIDDQPKEVALSPKPQILTAVPLNVVPAVVSMINVDNNKPELMPENTINTSSSQVVEEPLLSQAEDQKADKEDKSSDSDVASSYYHSKIYYISY